MEDITEILLTALVPAIETATGKKVYTRMPKAEDLQYPYIYISDIYITEDGPKTEYHYNVDLMVQVVHLNLSSLKPLLSDKNAVMGLINNGKPFQLSEGYEIQSLELGSSSNIEAQTELGTENIGVIRVMFYIV